MLVLFAWFAYLAIATRTPNGRFAFDTGITLPPDAKLIEETRDYTVGMRDSFSSEGTSLLVFQVSPEGIERILASSPPWGRSWKRGPVPIGVNESRPVSDQLFLSETGDAGNGRMLAVDAVERKLWLYGWDW